jgi:hypothetical protein
MATPLHIIFDARRLLMCLIAITALTFLVLPSASFAATPTDNDVALTISTSASSSEINAGDDFDLSFTITNVGVNPINPVGAVAFYFSDHMTYNGLISGYENSACVLPETDQEIFVGETQYFLGACSFDTVVHDGYLAELPVGATYTLTLSMTALSDFENDMTDIVAFLLPGNPEDERWTLVNAIESSTGVEDVANIDSNNVAIFTYNYSPGTVTTAPSTPTTAPTTSEVPVATNNESDVLANVSDSTRTTLEVLGLETEDPQDGSNLVDEAISQDSDEKAEVALDIRNSLPDRIGREDPGTWEALLSGSFKNQFILGTTILMFFFCVFYLFRTRYLKKVAMEREYRRALKAKSVYTRINHDGMTQEKVSAK